MSSRQLRKLRQQQELQKLESAAQEADDVSSDEPIVPKPKVNAFASFAALEDAAGDDDDDDDEPIANEPATLAEVASDVPKKKKKKAKKKKKTKHPTEQSTESPEVTAPAAGEDGLDEIDRALKQIDVDDKRKAEVRGPEDDIRESSDARQLAALLSINSTHLKVANEMRNLFDRETIQNASADSDPQAAGRPGGARQRQAQQTVSLEQLLKGRPGQSIPEVVLRRNPFIQGKEYWPKATAGGLIMKEVKDGGLGNSEYASEFTFAHEKVYSDMEIAFFMLVQTHDPMRLVASLQTTPYHVSTLNQVSKYAKSDQNLALAADLNERALFTFGRVTLSAFREKLQQGRARMDFRRPENRQFWLAGYLYIRSLIAKGTHRTALEWAKLFFSLSRKDEYGMLFFIAPLAIRAYESRWLYQLLDSHAMAAAVDEESDLFMDWQYISQTSVLALLQLRDGTRARARLDNGIRAVPWLFSSLFKELNLDLPKSIWGVEPPNSAHKCLTELFIHQTRDLWNNAEATSLLKSVAAGLNKSDLNPIPTRPEEATSSLPLRLERFISLLEVPDLSLLVPRGAPARVDSPNWEFDPLPPPYEDNIFSGHTHRMYWDRSDEADGSGASIEGMLARWGVQGPGDGHWDPETRRAALRGIVEDIEAAGQGERRIPALIREMVMPQGGRLGMGVDEAAAALEHLVRVWFGPGDPGAPDGDDDGDDDDGREVFDSDEEEDDDVPR